MHRWRRLGRLTAARLRVHFYRLIGGSAIDRKCLFESGVRIDLPWRVTMGPRVVLHQNVWCHIAEPDAALEIADHAFIGRNVVIEVADHITIGAGALIGPNVYITDHNHGTAIGRPMFEQATTISPIQIGADVWIGANSVILPGVTIGPGAIIGAGAVVNRNVPANAIVAGVPARVIGHRQSAATIDIEPIFP